MIKKIKVKINKLSQDAKVPIYGTEHSTGFDIYSNEEYELQQGETKPIGTGISLEIPEGTTCLIWDRSGFGVKGIHRFAGVIDSDYRGEIKIVLHNHTNQTFKINKHERIAQGIIQDYYKAEFQLADNLSETQRGEGGFGSTGLR